jgi:hypothetical protein
MSVASGPFIVEIEGKSRYRFRFAHEREVFIKFCFFGRHFGRQIVLAAFKWRYVREIKLGSCCVVFTPGGIL